jgi:hypothetical protein
LTSEIAAADVIGGDVVCATAHRLAESAVCDASPADDRRVPGCGRPQATTCRSAREIAMFGQERRGTARISDGVTP